MKKKVVQILLILCLILTLVFGGCARSATSAPPPPTPTPPAPLPSPPPMPNPLGKPAAEPLDSDGDGYCDWFEVNIAHSDPKIPDNRYVIIFEYWEEGADNDGVDRALPFFRDIARVPLKNMIILQGKNATYYSLKKATEEIAAKANKNDVVILEINAHGSSGICGYSDALSPEEVKARLKADPNFCYADWAREHGSPGITYSELDEWLDGIKAKAIIISAACCGFNEKGVPILKDGASPRIIAPLAWYKQFDPRCIEFAAADENGNKDGYQSMEEYKNYENNLHYKDSPDWEFYLDSVIDTSDVASEIYITDCTWTFLGEGITKRVILKRGP